MFMVFEGHRLAIPSNKEFSVPQLKFMIKEVERITGRLVGPEEWDSL